jgi:virulence-associated protein VapD
MDVPIKKNGNWIFETFDSFYEMAYKKFPINEMIEEFNCETFKKYDLKEEIEWLENCVKEINSPIVFCHNDFRGSNIMVTESNNNNESENEKIILCDFEYSSYCYRGIDLGSIFAEWGRSWNDFMKLHHFPNDSTIMTFIDEYISESVKILGKEYSTKESNSLEQLLKEVKVFVLVSNMFFVTFVIKSDEGIESMPFDRKKNMV